MRPTTNYSLACSVVASLGNGWPDFFVRNPLSDRAAMQSGMLAWGQKGEYKHTSNTASNTG